MNEWLDKYGLVKTHKSDDSSGNGILYSVIYNIFYDSFNRHIPLLCLWRSKLGVLWRTPDNTYGNCSHDDYLAFGVRMLIDGNKIWPRMILWSCIKKLGFMRNDYKEKNGLWKSQMLRFPHVWIVMFAAAFPNVILNFLTRNILKILLTVSSTSATDASGMQLRFLNLYAIHLMGNSKPLREFIKKYNMAEIMKYYYDVDHPILLGYKNFRV
jgi:hypothetical protein